LQQQVYQINDGDELKQHLSVWHRFEQSVVDDVVVESHKRQRGPFEHLITPYNACVVLHVLFLML